MSRQFLQLIEWIGGAAAVLLGVIVVYLNDGNILWTLLWYTPLILLIEFGCFANRDRVRMDEELTDEHP